MTRRSQSVIRSTTNWRLARTPTDLPLSLVTAPFLFPRLEPLGHDIVVSEGWAVVAVEAGTWTTSIHCIQLRPYPMNVNFSGLKFKKRMYMHQSSMTITLLQRPSPMLMLMLMPILMSPTALILRLHASVCLSVSSSTMLPDSVLYS